MAKRNYKKQYRQAKATAKQLKKAPKWVIAVALILVVVLVGGYFIYTKLFNNDKFTPPVGDISFHFMTLGNNANGDCTYIKAGDNDILIDAGSESNSIDDIEEYLSDYIKDGTIEYLIVTHGDTDHIACLAGTGSSRTIFDAYKCEIIIDAPKTTKSTDTYNKYITNRQNEENNDGATHYTALQCYNNTDGAQRVYELADSVSMEILYNYYYEKETTNENDYSVCVMFKHGSRQFLFTGDLEESGENKLAQKYDFTQVELFKAGHHGSQTASNDELLDEIKPKIVVIPCVAGHKEYSKTNPENIFPAVRVLESIAKYTSKVYVPVASDENGENLRELNGDIVVTSSETEVVVNCSNNNTLLKDTSWIKANELRKNISWVA